MGKATPVYKIFIWDLTYADSQFSKFIRKRDPKCRRCFVEDSDDNSHYVGRSNFATRFDPLNCIGLCRPCHELWEVEKKGAYKKFMINWLGKNEFEALVQRGRSTMKRFDSILRCMELCKKDSPPHQAREQLSDMRTTHLLNQR